MSGPGSRVEPARPAGPEAPRRRAVVVADGPAGREVAGLPLAARAVLALARAGAGEVVLFGREIPEAVTAALARRRVSTGRWRTVAEAIDAPGGPLGPEPVLVLDGAALVHDLVWPVLEGAPAPVTRLTAPEGPTPAVLGTPRALAPVLRALEEGAGDLDAALAAAGLTSAPSRPLAAPLVRVARGPWPGRSAEDRLLDQLATHTQAADGYLSGLVDRRLSRPITRWLLATDVAPGHVTLAGLALGLVGAAGLATVSYGGRILGVLFLVASLVLDCVDGELARARHQASAEGARLDLAGDYAVHLAVFLGLVVGLARRGLSPAGLTAALVALAGVSASMALVHRRFVGPALLRAGDLHHPAPAADPPGATLDAVLTKVASRDYTYLLLVLALADRLDWFVYAVAAGSWGFALAVVLRPRA